MALTWYSGGQSQDLDGPSAMVSDRSSTGVCEFFFYCETVATRGTEEKDRALDLLGVLDGDAVEFYPDTFASDGLLYVKAENCASVKPMFLEQYGSVAEPKKHILKAVASRLDYGAILGSLQKMEVCFEKGEFTAKAKFGLLRNAVLEYDDPIQFVVFCGGNDRDGLKMLIKSFVAGKKSLGSHSTVRLMPPPKKVLQRGKEAVQPKPLETKVNELAIQLAEISLLVKTTKTGKKDRANVEPFCNHSNQPGHYENRFHINPHRDNRRGRCGRMGHYIVTCGKRPTEAEKQSKFDEAKRESQAELCLKGRNSEKQNQTRGNHISVVTEEYDQEEFHGFEQDIVNTTKRDADRFPVQKQANSSEPMEVMSLLNPDASKVRTRMTKYADPKKESDSTKKRTKKLASKSHLQEHAGKYSLYEELANASTRTTFGNLLLGDIEDARKGLRRVIAGKAAGRKVAVATTDLSPRRLKVVDLKAYGTQAQALLDSGALANLLSLKLFDNLGVRPQATRRKVTVADGSNAVVHGFLHGVPIKFGDLHTALDFLVVDSPPFDIVVGCPALESLNACIALGSEEVCLEENSQRVVFGLDSERAEVDTKDRFPHTDREDFTLDSEAIPSEMGSSVAVAGDDCLVNTLDGHEVKGPEAALVTVNGFLDRHETITTPSNRPASSGTNEEDEQRPQEEENRTEQDRRYEDADDDSESSQDAAEAASEPASGANQPVAESSDHESLRDIEPYPVILNLDPGIQVPIEDTIYLLPERDPDDMEDILFLQVKRRYPPSLTVHVRTDDLPFNQEGLLFEDDAGGMRIVFEVEEEVELEPPPPSVPDPVSASRG